MSKKYVYLFSEGNATMRELLGGKGCITLCPRQNSMEKYARSERARVLTSLAVI